MDPPQFSFTGNSVALEELVPFVKLERAGVFTLIHNVWHRSGSDKQGFCRDSMCFPRTPPLSNYQFLLVEHHFLQRAEFVRYCFEWIHRFHECDTFFEAFDDFFVVQPVCGGIRQEFSIEDLYAPPGTNQRDKIGLFVVGYGAATFVLNLLRVTKVGIQDTLLFFVKGRPNLFDAVFADEYVVSFFDFLNLNGVVRHEFRRRVNCRESAADDKGR